MGRRIRMGRTPKLTSHAFSIVCLRSWFLRFLTLQTGSKESKTPNSCPNETARRCRCSPAPLRFPDWPTSIFSLLHSSSSVHIHSQAPQDFMDDPACEVSEIVCFYYLREDAIISKTILPLSSTQNCSVNVYRPHV